MKRPNISTKVVLRIAALLAVAFLIGRYTGSKESDEHMAHDGAVAVTSWTCSMHPQIDLPEPGKCPLCGMDLIPRKGSGSDDIGERMMSMSEAAMKLAEVRTAPVERKFVDIEIPMVGRVDYDETRVKTISAWTAGRLDRLFVDYTGIPVKKGDHLVEIYSPELYTAQEELLQAIKSEKELEDSENDSIRMTAKATVRAVREKLKLLGLNADQIVGIELQEAPLVHTEITAPIGGIVINKHAKEGMYVVTGSPIYTVADLSMLWVQLDAYESDLAWIKYGQDVDIRTETYGDRVFRGWISFIDPVLDPTTRTVKVRVVVENKAGLLRPNMFARASVKARVGEDDVVVTSNLEGKWICPMHPEVVKDEAGDCDVCGMALVQAGQIGYVSNKEVKKPIVVPASAVLITGKRAIVYRKVPGRERPTFEGVQIVIGPRAGDYYIVRSGLKEGEDIVVNGNFKIDSALQLMAKPSMMSADDMPEAENVQAAPAGNSAPALSSDTQKALSDITFAYFAVQSALAQDNGEHAKHTSMVLGKLVRGVNLAGTENGALEKLLREIAKASENLGEPMTIQKQREQFAALSSSVERLLGIAAPPPETKVYKVFCPMAFDNKGASWLQAGKEVMNPYFGSAMLHCGEVRKVFGERTGEEDQHESR